MDVSFNDYGERTCTACISRTARSYRLTESNNLFRFSTAHLIGAVVVEKTM
jgi:hypothetical protein